MYGAADYRYHVGSMLIDPREVGINGYPDAVYAEIGAVGRVPIGAVGYPESDRHREHGSLGERTGAVPCCEQVTVGGSGARPKEARTTGYYWYTGVPTDIMRADQATVSGCIGWTGQAGIVGSREPDEHFGQTVQNGRRTGVDTAGVAGSVVDTTSRTPSIWAGVKLAKLHTGVRPSDSDSGIAELSQSAYLRQLNELRPVAPTQPVSSYVGYPQVMDTGAGMASVPGWNCSIGSWVRAPQVPSTSTQTNVAVRGWQAGFIPEAQGTLLSFGPMGTSQLNQLLVPPEYRPQAASTPAGGRMTCQMLKLQRFEGTESLDTFLLKFQNMARYLHWNEEDALYHLCGSLKGAAGQVLWDIGSHAMTADVIQLLQTRFSTHLQVERFKAELCTRCRCQNEMLQTLY